jgi:hypothetical protein
MTTTATGRASVSRSLRRNRCSLDPVTGRQSDLVVVLLRADYGDVLETVDKIIKLTEELRLTDVPQWDVNGVIADGVLVKPFPGDYPIAVHRKDRLPVLI